eukprot:CAMPEP_0172305440 /NCGR_PEP_ID=MMETSP1058-20130122/6728_1 /TAXON_ID=83371 /ORGANISM="Detonula confervacea, Strain CCMP 353" /LENGTH=359 /DNA_ID=CAMNT_0013017039 /DNA_START=287 /DNA_END=1366 /DNA_ORIENTATION=-
MGWEDIEKMTTINLREELLALLNKEHEYALLPDGNTNRNGPSSSDDDESFDAMRRNVCQWKYECVDYFQFDREVVYLSMHFFDRFWARQTSKPSIKLSHLLALTSLYVACKLHGVATESSPSNSSSDGNSSSIENSGRVRIRLNDFCNMSRGTYCPQMLEEMELTLLTNLQWRLHPPTPTDYLNRFVKILSLLLKNDPTSQYVSTDVDHVGKGWSVFEVARYQIELAVYIPELSQQFLPSKIALAAILNAMDSKIVRTKRSIISSHLRHSFLQQLKCLGGGFAELNVEGEDMVEVRMTLKKLCSKTIVLPGQIVDDEPSNDTSFRPIKAEAKSFEYELPEVQSLCGSSTSPTGVATDHF